MPRQNLRHNPLPSIFLRPIPARRALSAYESAQVNARLLRARAKIRHHQRTMRILGAWSPLFKLTTKRQRARAKVMQQVRQQRKRLPLSVWHVAIGHALEERNGPEGAGTLMLTTIAPDDDSDEEDGQYSPRPDAASSSSAADESGLEEQEEDLEETKLQDRIHLKLEQRTKKAQAREERKVRREAARGQRLERKFLRTVSGHNDSDSDDEEMAKFVKEHEQTSRALDAARELKKREKASPLKRIQPTLLTPAKASPSKRIQPTLVQSIELPSDDSDDEEYVPDQSMIDVEEESGDDGLGGDGLALRARLSEQVSSDSGSNSDSGSDSEDDAMDEDAHHEDNERDDVVDEEDEEENGDGDEAEDADKSADKDEEEDVDKDDGDDDAGECAEAGDKSTEDVSFETQLSVDV